MKIKQPGVDLRFLDGGGEMGELTRSKDWSKTPLGSPESWPQSLRTTLGIILNSKFPMFLWWGPNLICFYNDAYRPSLGQNGKHPSILGMKAEEAWTEIWDIIKPLIDQVLAGGDGTWSEDQLIPIYRNGKIEDVYWTFSYSPVSEETGEIGGVLVTCSETTEKVQTLLKLKSSEQRFRNLIKEAMIGTAVFSGENMVLELANEAALEIWNKDRSVFGKPLLEFMPELKGQPFLAILDHVYMTGKTYLQEEAIFNIIRNGTLETLYVDFSYKALRDEQGLINGILAMGLDVTEKVNTRKKLEESERKLRLIILQAPVSIGIFRGPDYITEIVNSRALELWGRKEEEVLNLPILEAMPELKSQGIKELMDDVYKTGNTFSAIELPIQIMRNGKLETAYINFNYEPLYNTDGDIDGIMAVGVEVTAQVLVHKKIEANEEKLNIVIDASELATYELNLKTGEINYSKRYLEIMGYEQGTKLTHPQLLKHLHPDDLTTREKAFKEAFSSGILHYESRIIWNDKTIHWIESRGKVFYDEDGSPLKLIGTGRDITDEKNYQKQLEDREHKFRLLADSMPQFIWTGDPEGNLNYYNQSVFDYSGLTQEQLNKDGWLQIVHPADREGNIKAWSNSITTGKDFLFEHRFRKHTGEYRWQLSRAIPQRDENGKIQMWVGTSTDIQEQKTFATKLESQVQERTRELEQKNIDLEKMNKELQSFAYISSHDLQEPLRKIQTFASRIAEREQQNLSENGLDYFKRMQGAAERMQRLIDDLLAYSRTNNTERKYEVTDLNKIVEEVKADLKEELQQKNATIETTEMCDVNIMPFQFRQLLHNLISNSLKFASPEQAPHIKIKSEIATGLKFNNHKLSDKTTYCHISFSDNGIGFEQQYSEKIFELFQRLHAKKQYTGTGIGLAIVKKIIENHNGIIEAKAQVNKGATFDMFIPVADHEK